MRIKLALSWTNTEAGNFGQAGLIIHLMRIFLLVLMMTLLPLRAGLGDVMAVERTRPAVPADMGPATAHDCHAAHGHASAGHPDAHATLSSCADGAQTGHDCGDCTVCHVAALAGTPLLQLPFPAGSTPPRAPVFAHLSADPAPGLKPPIV